MAGTIPLMSQVPANEPINNSINRAGKASEILLLIPSKISDHVVPLFPAKTAQKAAESKSAIWLDPERESSP